MRSPPSDAEVLEALVAQERSRQRPVYAHELAVCWHVSTRTVSAALSRLEDEGLARPVPTPGMPRGNGTRRWRAAPRG
jgi:Mn-dependent DtxR family transcriptional regulator